MFFGGHSMKIGKLPVFGHMHAAFYVSVSAHWLIDWLVDWSIYTTFMKQKGK